MTSPVETAELEAFVKTVESRSLARAAAALRVPRTTIGRRLARLEERLGVRLLRRTTRSLAFTSAGEAFYHHARVALDAVAQAEQAVRQRDTTLRGSLRVALPPMADLSLHGLLCDFAQKHPGVQLHTDFSSRVVDLRREGYDVALRAGTAIDPGLVARTLQRMSLTAVASADYVKAHGLPRTPRDLRAHRLLLGFARGEMPETYWPLHDGSQVQVEGVFFSNSILLLHEAVLRGLGIALLPSNLTSVEIEQGRFVPVLPDVIGIAGRLAIVYAEREFVPPQVRAFIDMLSAWATLNPDLARPSLGVLPTSAPRKETSAKREPRSKAASAREPRPKRAR